MSLKSNPFGNDHNPRGRHREPLRIFIQMVPDLHPRRDLNLLIDNRPLDLRIPSDIRPFQKDRIFDLCKTMNRHSGREDGSLDISATDNAAT